LTSSRLLVFLLGGRSRLQLPKNPKMSSLSMNCILFHFIPKLIILTHCDGF
jgi:hypothetical protein